MFSWSDKLSGAKFVIISNVTNFFSLNSLILKYLLDYKNPLKFKRVFIYNLFPFRLFYLAVALWGKGGIRLISTILIVEGKKEQKHEYPAGQQDHLWKTRGPSCHQAHPFPVFCRIFVWYTKCQDPLLRGGVPGAG